MTFCAASVASEHRMPLRPSQEKLGFILFSPPDGCAQPKRSRPPARADRTSQRARQPQYGAQVAPNDITLRPLQGLSASQRSTHLVATFQRFADSLTFSASIACFGTRSIRRQELDLTTRDVSPGEEGDEYLAPVPQRRHVEMGNTLRREARGPYGGAVGHPLELPCCRNRSAPGLTDSPSRGRAAARWHHLRSGCRAAASGFRTAPGFPFAEPIAGEVDR